VLSLEVESEGFTESYFLLASDCHRTPLKIGIGTLLLTQLIVTKKEAFQLLFNCGVGGVRTLTISLNLIKSLKILKHCKSIVKNK
jgi:hypothetical protein